jgi:hypothetical protein
VLQRRHEENMTATVGERPSLEQGSKQAVPIGLRMGLESAAGLSGRLYDRQMALPGNPLEHQSVTVG